MANTDTLQSKLVTSRLAGLEYFTLRDYGSLLWRRRLLIVTVTLVVAIGVSLVAYRIPDQYQASTTIIVDPGRVPESYVKSTATIDANQRLALLQQQILSDTRLSQIADELGLYRNAKNPAKRDQLVEIMRSKISIDATLTAPP